MHGVSPADAVLWFGLALLVATFGVGRRRLLTTPGGRQLLSGAVGPAGWTGIAVLVVALAPPVDGLAETSLAVHMGQHLTLLLAAAPALIVGRAVAVLGAAAPRQLREQRRHRAGTAWTRPLLAAAMLAAVWWIWHAPSLYALALEVPVVHGLEHLTMLGAAWLFWAVVLDADRRNERGVAVVAVFVTALHMTAMAALLSFSSTPWLASVVEGGIDPALDQQVAGGLLWFPGGTVWIGVGSWLVWRWLRDDELASEGASVA